MLAFNFYISSQSTSIIFYSILGLIMVVILASVIADEGFLRFIKFIIRWSKGLGYKIYYHNRRKFGAVTLIRLMANLGSMFAGAIILFYPFIPHKTRTSGFWENFSLFFKNQWLLPVCLFYLWLYKYFTYNSVIIKKPKREKQRLSDLETTMEKFRSKIRVVNSNHEVLNIRKEILDNIKRKIEYLTGHLDNIEIRASLLVPVDIDLKQMQVIARSNNDQTQKKYSSKFLVAARAILYESAQVEHDFKKYIKNLPKNIQKRMKRKKYRSILAMPLRVLINTKTGYVGVVTIDADVPYYFLGKKMDIEISLSPYLKLLAMTLPKTTPIINTDSLSQLKFDLAPK